jgi:hypothetical protein
MKGSEEMIGHKDAVVPRWLFTLCVALISSLLTWAVTELEFISSIRIEIMKEISTDRLDIRLLDMKLDTHITDMKQWRSANSMSGDNK